MKYLSTLIAILLLVSFGCKNKKCHDHVDANESESPLYKEVMAIHDAVMPEISTIHKLKKDLKAAQDDLNKDLVLDHIKQLNDADEAMMSWMSDFKTPEDTTAAKTYLMSEKIKIQAVSDQMAQSILKSTHLLDSLNLVK